MTQIRELHGLKVRAIAVQVPEDAIHISIQGDGICWIESNSEDQWPAQCMALPQGNWEILGRANELRSMHEYMEFNGVNYYDYISRGYFKASSRHSWLSFCAVNSITNELILIEK